MHNNLLCETQIFRLWDRWKISFDENFCGFFLVGNARWEISQEMPYLVSLNLPLLLKDSIQRWMTTWSGSWSSWKRAKACLVRPASRWPSRWSSIILVIIRVRNQSGWPNKRKLKHLKGRFQGTFPSRHTFSLGRFSPYAGSTCTREGRAKGRGFSSELKVEESWKLTFRLY